MKGKKSVSLLRSVFFCLFFYRLAAGPLLSPRHFRRWYRMWQHDLYNYHLLPTPWEQHRGENQEAKARGLRGGGKRQWQQKIQNWIEELLLKVLIILRTLTPLNSDHWENFKDSSIRKSVLVLNNSKTQATRTVNPDHLFFVLICLIFPSTTSVHDNWMNEAQYGSRGDDTWVCVLLMYPSIVPSFIYIVFIQ